MKYKKNKQIGIKKFDTVDVLGNLNSGKTKLISKLWMKNFPKGKNYKNLKN